MCSIETAGLDAGIYHADPTTSFDPIVGMDCARHDVDDNEKRCSYYVM